jgi:hypothetical protein
MTNLDMLLPVFAQVALTFVLMARMARLRTGAVRDKQVRIGDIALGEPAWPPRVLQASNAYRNQFELPVLFYVLAAMAMITSKVTLIIVILAWLFVVARIVHAFIHTGSNFVPNRFYAFAVSAFALVALWIVFAIEILVGPL